VHPKSGTMFPGVMREQDIRQRIESFLKRTARELIIPASVGLSLGLNGCMGCSADDVPFLSPSSATVFSILPDASANVKTDAPPACPLTTCPALSCTRYGSDPRDPCSCPICLPTPDAGVAKDLSGPDSPWVCTQGTCSARVLCPGGYLPNPDNPCGCPICAPTPDAGVDAVAQDAGVDAEMIDGEMD
jgi:hypothetical protein